MSALVAESGGIVVLDAFRYLAILMGFILLAISGFAAYHAFKYAEPLRLRVGLTVLWIGRTLMVIFMCTFVIHRLGQPLNWYTPVIFITFVCMVVGNWMSRDKVAAFVANVTEAPVTSEHLEPLKEQGRARRDQH